jgi:ElaB/YqjD/DUF883 family membrane-anchored ribosome-binding protein
MNEFVTDPENAAETAMNETGEGITAVIERGMNIYKAAGERVAKEVCAANAALHGNPYPTVLAGIGAGALIGFIVASRRNGGSNQIR